MLSSMLTRLCRLAYRTSIQHVFGLMCREYINVALITIGISVFMLLKVSAMLFACAYGHSFCQDCLTFCND